MLVAGGKWFVRSLTVPSRFIVGQGGGRPNLTFESLTLSPNGRSLFTANEGHLTGDGQTSDLRSRIRILRYGWHGNSGWEPEAEYFYLTEPGRSPTDLGVVELIALSERELLLMERGFVAGQGSTVRVFKVSLQGAQDVAGVPSLSTPELEPVAKSLLFDLALCPPSGASNPGVQPNPLLDNFEGMTLGPILPGGRRSLVLVSDDNGNPSQVTRLLAVAVKQRLLR